MGQPSVLKEVCIETRDTVQRKRHILCKSKELGLLQYHKFQSFSSSSPQSHDNLKRKNNFKNRINFFFFFLYWNVFRAFAYVETRCHESRGRISMNGICVAVTSGQQHALVLIHIVWWKTRTTYTGQINITHQITTDGGTKSCYRPHIINFNWWRQIL